LPNFDAKTAWGGLYVSQAKRCIHIHTHWTSCSKHAHNASQ